MFQYTLDQITTKSPNNIVPMTLLMINQLVTEEIVHYQGFKCDSIILVAYVLDVAPTVSKRGHFQLIFTLRDASGSATLRCILTSYEDNDFLNNLLRRNRITSLKDFHYVKCVLQPAKSNKKPYHDLKYVEKVLDHNEITQHFLKCINFYCQLNYAS